MSALSLRRWLPALVLASSVSAAAPAILYNSNHAASDRCIRSLAGDHSGIATDMTQTCGFDLLGVCSTLAYFLEPETFVGEALDPHGTYYAWPDDAKVNHAVYRVISQSSSGYEPQVYDQTVYAAVAAHDILYTMAFYPGVVLPQGTPPPVAMSVVSCCDCSVVGAPGPGAEFCVPGTFTRRHSGCSTDSPSASTATLAQVEAVLELRHRDWNAFDTIGALRQTARQWQSGYDPGRYGYGAIDFEAADVLGASSGIFLQPPLMRARSYRYFARIKLYPFRQSRRAAEQIYAVNPRYAWPRKNEYSAADLRAAGASLLFTSKAGDMTPVFDYVPARSGRFSLAAFTTDGSRYSRVESFSVQSFSLSRADLR